MECLPTGSPRSPETGSIVRSAEAEIFGNRPANIASRLVTCLRGAPVVDTRTRPTSDDNLRSTKGKLTKRIVKAADTTSYLQSGLVNFK